MSDYLYYCGKCNSLISDSYDDEDMICDQCGGRMIPLHIDEGEWDDMSDEDKVALLERNKNSKHQDQKKRPTTSSTTSGTYRSATNSRSKRVEPGQQSYSTQSYNGEKDYYDKVSGMSIAAFVFSILGCTSIVGLILGIVDLSKKDGRKRGLSIAAVVISTILIIAGMYNLTGDNPIISHSKKKEVTEIDAKKDEKKMKIVRGQVLILNQTTRMTLGK